MAFIPTLACVQARIQYLSTANVFAENVLYFATPGAPTTEDLENIGEALEGWCEEALKPSITNNWQITGLALRAMNEEEGIQLQYNTDFPKTGTGGTGLSALSIAYTVTWGTGLVGRSARGRTYGLGIENANIVNGNRLSDAARAFFQGKWYGLITTMESAGYALQVVSFVEGGVPRANGRKLPVLSANVRFPLANQRRRLA